MRHGIIGLDRNRLLQQIQRLIRVSGIADESVGEGAEVKVVGIEAVGRLALARSISACRSFGSIAPTTLMRDLVLHREDVVERRGRSARPRHACRSSASISWPVTRTRLPALRTLPSST